MAKVYNAKLMSVSFCGVQLFGWANGDFLTIDNDSDTYGDDVGTDGEVTRFVTSDDRATITIVTMQSSGANDILTAIYQLDKLAPNGLGIGTFSASDINGTSSYLAESAWIAKPPQAVFGREVKPREWKIRCERLDRFDGSNFGTDLGAILGL